VPEETQITKRYRTNVATSVKGVKTYDCTVETTGLSMKEHLAEHDQLVAEMDKRYPAVPV